MNFLLLFVFQKHPNGLDGILWYNEYNVLKGKWEFI